MGNVYVSRGHKRITIVLFSSVSSPLVLLPICHRWIFSSCQNTVLVRTERPKDDRFCHLSYDSWIAKYVTSSKVLLDLVVICGELTDYL
jgi:hypothetical protein